jgi:C1A family cysteine protease
MFNRLLRTTFALSLALSAGACGGDNGLGPTIELTEDQTNDMLDALSAIGAFDAGVGFSQSAAAAMMTDTPVALATVSLDETYDCPNGGTYRSRGNISGNDAGTQATISLTQTYSNCAGQSSTGTVWTFNTAPSIATNMSINVNEAAGTFSLNATQNGAFNVSSSIGSGSCVINLPMSISGNETSETLSMSVTGTVCGRNVSQTLDIS